MSSQRRDHCTITFVRLIQTPRGTHRLRGRYEIAESGRWQDDAAARETAVREPARRRSGRHRPVDGAAA
jgi:hypothetical protein